MFIPLMQRQIVLLELSSGQVPFERWYEKLAPKYQCSVDARITRLAVGNFGDHKSVGDGVYELRIMKGPGLRIYYGLRGTQLVVLIGGGDKSTQKKDIKRVKTFWRRYCEN